MEKGVDNIFDVVRWFLHNQPMTHKKLQKLLYFSYGIYLADNNSSEIELNDVIFDNKFQAWVHGPVDPDIFSMFKYNGVNLLYIEKVETFDFNIKVLSALNKTLDSYGKYSADELENITHKQAPWINARCNLSPIEPSINCLLDSDIFKTFSEV